MEGCLYVQFRYAGSRFCLLSSTYGRIANWTIPSRAGRCGVLCPQTREEISLSGLCITAESRGLLEAGFMLAPVCERSKEGAIVLDKRVMIEQSGYRGLITEVGMIVYTLRIS